MLTMNIRRFAPLEYQVNEAINTLCMNLFFAGGDIKKIMITSCQPQEGKSFLAMNLMRSLAGLGLRVVLVDADIRASALQGTFDIGVNLPEGQKYLGLTRYLAGRCRIEDILAQTDIPNAYMILSGHNVINSLPLLSTPHLQRLLDGLAKEFDVVLVDAPPVGAVIDAAKVAEICDGTVFVVKSGAVSHTELRSAMQQIEKAGSPILGTVLNQYDAHKHGDKYYYGGSYYTSYGSGRNARNRKKANQSVSKRVRNFLDRL